MCQSRSCPLALDFDPITPYSIKVNKEDHLTTTELFNDYTEMTKIAVYAEENELTVDYVIEEFVINNQLIEVN